MGLHTAQFLAQVQGVVLRGRGQYARCGKLFLVRTAIGHRNTEDVFNGGGSC